MKVRNLLFVLLFGSQLTTTAQLDRKVQAGIIQYIVQNMEWHDSKNNGVFLICVVGEDPIYSELELVFGGKVHKSQKINVRNVTAYEELKGAHLIYLSDSKVSQFSLVQQKAAEENALLITSKSGLGAKGSGINFITKDSKQAYEINKSSLRRNNLKASSKLVALGIELD